ncbi:MAG: trypsin-like peptidase domain-containing protein [Anaerolineales bacterium]|nr:trypsin-like peptidase domain-containing protein [Anaerolineales bacterium]
MMKAHFHKSLIWALILVMAVSLGCNLSVSTEKATATPENTATPEATATPETPVGLVTTLDAMEKAVIYIEAAGSYRDPEEGWQANVGGSGTGFIIDPAGIAVTNNHVVAYAATLQVKVYGEEAPRSAVVLGVSECSDLAVIDIDGDGFSYLDWYQGEIKAGLDVYTAGFPISGAGIGYSLTKGIVSKTTGSVNWTTASVSNIIEHTAKVNPGNSGGPLATEDGKVVGVNFGFTNLDQNYAVARDEARAVIDQLRGGMDLDSLGVNGVGVSGKLQDNPVVGVWVRSVKPGSPAEIAGLQPGDIITQMDGTTLDDGTLGGYCSVVRSHSPEDVFPISVVRSDTLEVLEGEINGAAVAYTSTLSSGGGGGGGELGNPNASQSGEAFFTTQFDSPDYWNTLRIPDSDAYRAFTDDGKLYLEISPAKVGLYTFYDLVLQNSDVRVETYAQKVAGPNTNNISVVCRATDAGWYEFSMTSGGYWYIWLYTKADGFQLLKKGATTAIQMKNQPNQIAATCIGNVLTFIINGIEVGSASDRTYPGGGQVGVSIYAEYPDLGVEFDWFTATVP